MVRTAIYARLSRNRNGESTSIDRQIAVCRERFAPDWQEVGIYQDDDFSAYRKGVIRPEFERMLADAQAGKVDVIVAYALDRLLRRDRDLSRLLDIGVRFITVRDGLDTNNATGQLVTKIMAAIAQNESDTIGARIRLKHDELRSQGRWSGGRRAFGLNDDWSAIVPEEAALIREAAEHLLSGGSMVGIVRDWNDRGIRTRSGKRWDISTLRRTLLAPRMIGRRQVGGELSAEAGIPAVLDDETWHRLRARLTDPGRPTGAGGRVKYLAAGILECGRCHARMFSHNMRPRRRYRCLKDRGGCGKVSINAVPAEIAIANAWLKYTNGPEFQEFTANARATREARLRDIEGSRSALSQALDRRNSLIDLWAAGELSQDEWKRARSAIETQIKELEAAIQEGESDASDLSWWSARGLAHLAYTNASVEDRRSLLLTVIEKVIIHPAKGRGRRFDATRVEPIFRPQPSGLHPGELTTVRWFPRSDDT